MPQGQLTSVELLSLQAKFVSLKRDCGHITTKTLPGLLKKLKGLNELVSDEDIGSCLLESYAGRDQEVDFDSFVQVYQSLQARVTANEGANEGGGGGGKALPSFLKSNTTTLQYNPDEAEKLCYVVHINTYLGEDPFLKNYLPIDPTGNQLFDLVRDGVLLCKLINVAVPGTIDERAINKKRSLNLWERNENHTLCLKSATAIGCTVINIGAQDLEEGRPHLVLGLVSQIIKIHKAKITQRESMDVDGPCSEGSMFSDSCEDMRNGGSQNAVSSPDGDSGLGDMGDADSDISNLEAFLSQDETESEDDEFNIEDELDDDEYQLDSYNQSLEAPDKGAEEEAKHNDDIVNILDDYYEMQVECGLVTRWAFINYSTLPYIKSQRFLDKLQNTCLSLGMADFANQPIREFRETVDLATVKDLLDALKIELVLLIPPCFVYNYGMEEKKDKIEQIEKKIEQIEQMCESLGIAYQSCHPLDPKGTKSLAREIQFKVVKRLILLRRLELPLVREAPTIIFGADMVEVEDSKSVASVVASVDWPKFRKYFGAISLQPYNGGVIKDFCSGGMMIKYLNFFYKKNGERPKRLIFFRNGLEEGQLDYICQQEIYAIKQASVKEGYPLSLTYVIVLPRKVWRGTLSKNEHGTPLPYPVFVCRHSTERVSMVSHYCVFHDDNNFPAGQLQALTSQLRTFRHRWENPRLNTVVPAFLARQKIFEELRKRELI